MDEPVFDREAAAVVALIRRFHKIPGCEVGGPLHIVIDDPNYEDEWLDFCEAAIDEEPGPDSQGWWRAYQDAEATAEMVEVGREIIARLRPMTLEQREVVCSW